MHKRKLRFGTATKAILCRKLLILFALLVFLGCVRSNMRTFSVGLQRKVAVIDLPSGPHGQTITNIDAVSRDDVRNAIINSLQIIGFSSDEPGLPPCSDLDPLPKLSSKDIEFCTDVHELKQSQDPILRRFRIDNIKSIGVPTDEKTYYGIRFRGRWTSEEKAPSNFQLNPNGILPGTIKKSPKGLPREIKSPKIRVTLKISVVLYYRGYASSFVLYPDTHYDNKSMLDGLESMIRAKLKEAART